MLDTAVGSQPINFTGSLTDLGATTTSLGYPQATPYDGTVLRYCEGALGKDEYAKVTYRLPCGDVVVISGERGVTILAPPTEENRAYGHLSCVQPRRDLR